MTELLITILLLITAGCLVAAESAIVGTSKQKIGRYTEEKRSGARSLEQIRQFPDQVSESVRMVVLFLILSAAATSGLLIARLIEPIIQSLSYNWIQQISYPFSLLVAVAIMLFVIQLFVYGIPRQIGRRYHHRIALAAAPGVRWLITALTPPVRLLHSLAGIFPGGADKTGGAPYSRPEIVSIIEQSKRFGVIESEAYEIINRVLEFSETTAKEILIPRPDIVAIDIETPREEIVRIITEEGFSRVPVYEETLDNIIGILYAKDLIPMIAFGEVITLEDIIRPANFVPETKRIGRMLREFQRQKIHLAIVIDEFGGTEGIVTLEDIIEEIVGEIHDEYDEVKQAYTRSTDGTWIVDGGMNISDFNSTFSAQVPEDVDYETVNGFLHKITGRIPDIHEEIQFGNLSFTILRKSERRIEKIRVKRYQQSRIF